MSIIGILIGQSLFFSISQQRRGIHFVSKLILFFFQITALDPDFGENGRLTYDFCQPNALPDVSRPVGSHDTEQSVIAAVNKLFRIGQSKGELHLLFSPDREEINEYRFEVCVGDHGKSTLSAKTDVRVVIRDINDCQPQFEKQNYEFFVQVSAYPMFCVSKNRFYIFLF